MHFNQFVADNGSVTVNSGGVFTIGREINIGADINRFSSGTAIRFSRINNSSFNENNSDLRLNSGGTLHWYGGTIITRRNISFMEGSNIFTYSPNAILNGQHDAEFQLRMRAANANINGLTTTGLFVTFITSPTTWDSWTPFDTPNFALSFSGDAPSNVFIALRGFDPRGVNGVNGQQMAVWSNKWARLINCSSGSDVVFGGNSITSSPNNRGLYEIRQEVNLTFKDLTGGDVNAKFWMTDFNNGSRLAANQINNNPSYTSDRVYSGTASSGAASLTTNGGVLTAVLWRTVAGIGMNASNIYDRRNEANTNADLFTFYACEYTSLIDQADVVLKGIVPVSVNRIMFLDRTLVELDKSVVDAYTEIDTSQKLYDRAKAHLFDIFAGQPTTLVSRSGIDIDLGVNNLVVDSTASEAFTYDGTTITIKADTFSGNLTTTGTITFSNGAIMLGNYTDVNGTVNQPVTISAIVLADTRVQLFNVTTSTEIDNTTEATTSYSFTVNSQATVGNVIRLRLTKKGFIPISINAVFNANGITYLVNQVADEIYGAYGIDGATVTKFEIDIPNLDFDLNVVANFSGAELYAWYSNMLTTEDGVRSFFNAITPIDSANLRLNNTIIDVRLDNQTSSNVFQNDNIRIFRADGTYPVINPTSGGGGIDINWRNVVFTIETGTSGLTTEEALQLSSIKPDLTIINNGVKRTSLLIPYNDDLT
jgi:hypothetical protein